MNAFCPVVPSVKKNTLAVEIDSMLNDQKIWDAVVTPYFLNGGKCGHKVMDVKGAVDALREADAAGKLNAFKTSTGQPINDFKMGNVLKNVIRGRLHLNSKWKADGVNPKIAEANPDLAKMFADFLLTLEHKPATEVTE
jgi:hypothetical protein